MPKRSLLTGVAYHGNRMPTHVRTDMAEIARADMDIVVHMLSHTDWTRHKRVMKDIFAITEDAGLEVWVDNWGLGGAPGDCSHFLAFHPDAHMYYRSASTPPITANSCGIGSTRLPSLVPRPSFGMSPITPTSGMPTIGRSSSIAAAVPVVKGCLRSAIIAPSPPL